MLTIQGDACMMGPYRDKLLQAGTMGTLLKAAVSAAVAGADSPSYDVNEGEAGYVLTLVCSSHV